MLRVLFFACTLALLSTIPSFADIGGDDVLIESPPGSAVAAENIVKTSTGIYFATGAYLSATGREIRVYRSTDKGHTWAIFATFGSTNPDVEYLDPSLLVSEGTENHLMIAYILKSAANSRLIVNRTDPYAATPFWSFSIVTSGIPGSLARPSLVTDSEEYASYYTYLAWEELDGNGNDIRFARSTNYGFGWDPAYDLLIAVGSFHSYVQPDLHYSGGLHLAATDIYWTGTEGASVYRLGAGRVTNGSSWGSIQTFGTYSDGQKHNNTRVAADAASNKVMVAWNYPPGLQWRSSTNGGATFSSIKSSLNYSLYALDCGSGNFAMLIKPSGNPVAQLSWPIGNDLQGLWFVQEFLGPFSTHSGSGSGGLNYDEDEGEWMATLGMTTTDPIVEQLGFYFDAGWRDNPGFPNWDELPVIPPGVPQTAPALADMDGDNDLEIIYSDQLGRVQVKQPDGSDLPGWPRVLGTVDTFARVAVGDVDGGGDNEVVFCNVNGELSLIKQNGVDRTGWPVNLPTNDEGFVSIAPITGNSPQDIVVVSQNQLYVYDFLGNIQPGFPQTLAGNAVAAAALGDVDLDGSV
ncbi:MAG: hypothetical protein HKN21_06660, partial [Candidatus Eisenbacteria bacterium]|nr:hypothetical protein [Candidatus Eisenbacteria bacterium]